MLLLELTVITNIYRSDFDNDTKHSLLKGTLGSLVKNDGEKEESNPWYSEVMALKKINNIFLHKHYESAYFEQSHIRRTSEFLHIGTSNAIISKMIRFLTFSASFICKWNRLVQIWVSEKKFITSLIFCRCKYIYYSYSDILHRNQKRKSSDLTAFRVLKFYGKCSSANVIATRVWRCKISYSLTRIPVLQFKYVY